jgi:hypothetical protein
VYSYSCYSLSVRSTLPLPELELSAKRRGQRAPSLEHRAWSTERGARSEEQGAGSREQKSKGQSAGGGELNISNFGLRYSQELGAGSLEAAADVNIRFGKVDRLPAGIAVEGSYFRAIPEETHLFWEDVGTIQVRGGREITIDPVPGVQEDLLRHLILGPALAALLQQRGPLVLHASAVTIDDGAVAFLGAKGWGKSSVAGILYSRGYGIAADDVTAVHVGRGCPIVLPAFPQLKLWPDTAASLGSVAEELPELYSGSVKLAQRVDQGFSQAPLPLKAIYVLAHGTTTKVEPLAPGKAFLELVRHSYWAELLQASGASAHFLQCASITESTRIRYLRIPRSLSMLPDVARLVEEDVACYKSEDADSSHSL